MLPPGGRSGIFRICFGQEWIAIITVVLTQAATKWLTNRREHQRACRNTAALLAGYAEELEWGIRIMEEKLCLSKTAEQRRMQAGQIGIAAPAPTTLLKLPNAFWERYRVSEDGIYELYRLERIKVSQDTEYWTGRLHSHLKNCFENIPSNYLGYIAPIYVNSVQGWPPPRGLEDGHIVPFRKTLSATKLAIRELDATSRRVFPIPLYYKEWWVVRRYGPDWG